jgi:hypothetical protein
LLQFIEDTRQIRLIEFEREVENVVAIEKRLCLSATRDPKVPETV